MLKNTIQEAILDCGLEGIDYFMKYIEFCAYVRCMKLQGRW